MSISLKYMKAGEAKCSQRLVSRKEKEQNYCPHVGALGIQRLHLLAPLQPWNAQFSLYPW
jgi:hypothetical protein